MTDIVERANKALEGVTPGPWFTLVDEVASQVQGFPIVDSEFYEIIGTEGFFGDYETDWANARFIAEARDLVPALVSEIERLRAVAENLARVAAERVSAVHKNYAEEIPKMVDRVKREARAEALEEAARTAHQRHTKWGTSKGETLTTTLRHIRGLLPKSAPSSTRRRGNDRAGTEALPVVPKTSKTLPSARRVGLGECGMREH